MGTPAQRKGDCPIFVDRKLRQSPRYPFADRYRFNSCTMEVSVALASPKTIIVFLS